jgi:hypothetical protein
MKNIYIWLRQAYPANQYILQFDINTNDDEGILTVIFIEKQSEWKLAMNEKKKKGKFMSQKLIEIIPKKEKNWQWKANNAWIK